jgi:CheY-like chemotaxis protein
MSHRVLVVEDEPDIRLAARLLLESEGYTVSEAESGAMAVTMVEEDPPDAMLLDLRMSGMDGWETLEQLRANGRLNGLSVIVLSAHASKATVERAIELGACGYVRKPFDISDLTCALDNALGPRR